MVVPVIDTPRTDFGASTTQHGHNLADFTQSSIPSPSKERNDLVRGLRGLRAPAQRTPQSRLPFSNRNNLQGGKPEFTPLLKSATRNRSTFAGQENLRLNDRKPATPAGFRESYRSDLPDLPEHSSVLYEDDTATSEQEKSATPQIPPSSSSVMNTPVPALEGRGRNALREGQYGSLREQEARVEQLDKENFGLKLKIHYLEEAYRKSGKEFNDGLLKQVTDLQVDKLSLQRDLKHYRRQLNQALRDLETRQKPGDESGNAELERLRQAINDKDEKLQRLQETADAPCGHEQELERLRDDIADLEHDLRQRDQELDEKDERIEELGRSSGSSEDAENLRQQVEERDEDIKGLQDALRTASSETDRKLKEKDRALELKDDEVRDLEEELKHAGREDSFAAKGRELDNRQAEIDRLQQQLKDSGAQAKKQLEDLKDKLTEAERNADNEAQAHKSEVENLEGEIEKLEQKLAADKDRNEDDEKLQDQISDLEADIRQRDRSLEEKEDQINELQAKIKQIENDSDDELMAAQDRIQELEVEQERNLKDLQALREADNKDQVSRSQASETANTRIADLDAALNHALENEQQLQKDMHRLRDDVKHLERELDDKDTEAIESKQAWDQQRNDLMAERDRLKERISSLEAAMAQLRESEGTVSGKEMALQKLVDDSKKQHESAQISLQKQLNDCVAERDQLKASTQSLTGQLRDFQSQGADSSQQIKSLQNKVQSLEDEIEVLQTSFDEEMSRLKDDLKAARSEADRARSKLKSLQSDLEKVEAEHAATKADLLDAQQKQKTSTPTPKPTPRAARQMQERVQQLEADMRAAAKLEAELKEVDEERKDLQRRLAEIEAQKKDSSDDAETLVDSSSPRKISPRAQATESEAASLRSRLSSLAEEKQQLEDDLDLLTSDLEAATAARDNALSTVRDLRKQLADATRTSDHKYHSQVAEYERDISNLEDELSTARAAQREQEIKVDSANATITRLRKRLESLESDLATSRARERTSSESPEAGRRERRELQEALRKAQQNADDLQSRTADRDVEITSAQFRQSELQNQVRTLQRDRRQAMQLASTASSDLKALQSQHAGCTDDVALTKLRNRHGAELRGLAKQIEYLSAKCSRAERLRQDAAFAKGYVGKVVEVYARVHKMDLRLVREMGVALPRNAGEAWGQTPRKISSRVDQTPRSVKRKGMPEREEVVSERREKRPSLRQVAVAIRAAVRIRKKAEQWGVVRRSHEDVLRKWRSMREERRTVKA